MKQKEIVQELAEQLASSLSMKLVPVKRHNLIKKYKEYDALSTSQLREEMAKIDLQLAATRSKTDDALKKLKIFIEKQGPTEFTKQLFSSDKVMSNRLIVRNTESNELDKRRAYITACFEKAFQREVLGSTNVGVNILDAKIEQTGSGAALAVTIGEEADEEEEDE